ncbi:MAG: YceI family protein [Bacteroidetes bacterium]|nr:YceI family protein [Bacteroidota bacterium]
MHTIPSRMSYSSGACLVAALTLGVFSSCQKNAPKPTDNHTAQVKLDTVHEKAPNSRASGNFEVSNGVVYWAGRSAVGDSHNGNIQVADGMLKADGGKLLSGSVSLDMTSVTVVDLKDPGEKRDLESHLKDSDFFEVRKFPKAEFKFTEVYPSNMPDFNYVVSGTLTMKGKTKGVNIPVMLKISDNEIEAQSATFPINRTDWGINFRSGILGTASDKLIQDVVTVSFLIKAKKKLD